MPKALSFASASSSLVPESKAEIQNIFGRIPLELMALTGKMRQFSPQQPGSDVLEDVAPSSLASFVMLAPVGTLERRASLALALRALQPAATLAVMAPKDKGGLRLKKELTEFGCDVTEDARRHFRVCICQPPKKPVGFSDAVAAGAPRLLPDIGFWSQPGIFSWERIDPGSRLLVSKMSELSGSGADLGCGYGFLARAILKSASVTRLLLIDNDRRAIECAKRNIEDKRAHFAWADVSRHSVPTPLLDFVVMNPPFHESGHENRALGKMFIEQAHAWLKPGGTCWITANRHLPYEASLKTLFKQVGAKGEADGFKILEATK